VAALKSHFIYFVVDVLTGDGYTLSSGFILGKEFNDPIPTKENI
jgi:hypothetical protein